MNMETWAKNEVEIACKRKNPNRKEGEWDYGCACYESALKAYKSLLKDEHSGFSFNLTKNILIRLMNHLPLTPIEDIEENWQYSYENEEKKHYQCRRRSSLFKEVCNGRVTYSDTERYVGIDINAKYGYGNGMINALIDELYPITMPYYPSVNKYKVYTEDFLTDVKNGDYDTKAILYLITPEGERVEVKKYYKFDNDTKVEINEEEYNERKARRIDKGV